MFSKNLWLWLVEGLGQPATWGPRASVMSAWLLLARQPMHSVPAAGASGRSSARALRKGIEVIWDGGPQQMENCGSILAGEERAEVALLCQILCGWLPWPRDDFHCKGRVTLVVSVFGRKTSLDTKFYSAPERPCQDVWCGPVSRGIFLSRVIISESKTPWWNEMKGEIQCVQIVLECEGPGLYYMKKGRMAY